MKDVILKKTGRILFLTLLLIISAGSLFSAPEIETILSDKRIQAGDTTTLSLKISGMGSEVKPVRVPNVKGLNIQYSGMQRSYQYINGRSWKGVVLTFRITAREKGVYTIPPFEFRVDDRILKSAAVKLSVMKGSRRSVPGTSGGSGRISSVVELSKESLYAGEPVLMRHFILSSGVPDLKIKGIEKQPEAKGFVQKRVDEEIEDSIVTVDGEELLKSHVFSTVLVPAESGRKNIGGGSLIVAYNAGDSFFDFSRQTRIIFEKTEVNVKPLPDEGKPQNYSGDVGGFSIEIDPDESPVKAYQEKKLRVRIKGTGNLLTLSKPLLPKKGDKAKVLIERGDEKLTVENGSIAGERYFTVTVIPEEEGTLNLGPLTLFSYNPLKGKYERTDSKDIVIKVLENASKSQEGALAFEKEDATTPIVDPLIIIIVSVIIMGGILFLVFWERKRYTIVAKEEEIEKKEEINVENKATCLIRDIAAALEEGNTDKYLTSSYRFLDTMLKSGDEKAAWISRVEEIKEIISSNKFGGCKLSLKEMENLYHEMNRFIK